VYTLKRILGHADIETTERYVQAAGVDDIAAAVERMGCV
jgi:site-specific recombinase XerD